VDEPREYHVQAVREGPRTKRIALVPWVLDGREKKKGGDT